MTTLVIRCCSHVLRHLRVPAGLAALGLGGTVLAGCVAAVPAALLVPAIGISDRAAVQAESAPIASNFSGEGAGGEPPAGADFSSSVGNYLAGRFAYDESDFASAADYFSLALSEDPDNLALLHATLRMHLASGRFDRAVKVARRLVDHDTLSPLAQMTLAVIDSRRGDYADAEARLAPLERDGVYRLILPVIEAWLQYGKSGADSATDRLASLKATASFKVFHDFNAALISDLAERETQAEQLYLSALEEIGVESLRLVLSAGSFFERHGQIERARALYENYHAAHSTSTWLDDEFDRLDTGRVAERTVDGVVQGFAETLYGAAGVLPQQDQNEIGVIFVRLALELRPDFTGAQILLGELFESLGRSDEAIGAYRDVDLSASSAWPVRIRIAINLDRLGRAEEAVILLGDMTREQPHRSDAATALGDILRASERFGDAANAYDLAIAGETKFGPDHWTLFYSRGVSLERSKRWGEAERDFLKALELQPDQPYVLNYLGYSWIERGERLEEARSMIERAVELRPNDGYIVDSLGWAMYRQGEFADAVVELERAIELQPDDPTINDHLGDAYWRVGRVIEAHYQWERALLFDTDGILGPAIQRKIDGGLDAADAAAQEL